MIPDADSLVRLIDLYSERVGRSPYTISQNAAGQALLHERLKNGKGTTLRTAERALRWLSQNWPPDLPWPSDIPRPPTDDVGDGASTNKGEAA